MVVVDFPSPSGVGLIPVTTTYFPRPPFFRSVMFTDHVIRSELVQSDQNWYNRSELVQSEFRTRKLELSSYLWQRNDHRVSIHLPSIQFLMQELIFSSVCDLEPLECQMEPVISGSVWMLSNSTMTFSSLSKLQVKQTGKKVRCMCFC